MSKFKPEERKNDKLESINLGVPNQNQIPSTLDDEDFENIKNEDIKNIEETKDEKDSKNEKSDKNMFVDEREIDHKDPINRGVTNQNQIPSSIEKPGIGLK
ncbi:MAG: hypothetical protein Q4E02_01740 [Lagierella massiliensis]|nr:hypothetical protein [Lagierella massiliensis]